MYLYEQLLKDALTTITNRELGAEINVPATTINDWIILGKKPRLGTLEKIAEWAKLPVASMLLEADDTGHTQTIINLIEKLTPDQKLQTALYLKHLVAHPPPQNAAP